MSINQFPLSNDSFLLYCLFFLIICIMFDMKQIITSLFITKPEQEQTSNFVKGRPASSNRPYKSLFYVSPPPIHSGCKAVSPTRHLDIISLSKYIPINSYIVMKVSNSIQKKTQQEFATPPRSVRKSLSNSARNSETYDINTERQSAEYLSLSTKINILPDCEPDSSNANILRSLFHYIL